MTTLRRAGPADTALVTAVLGDAARQLTARGQPLWTEREVSAEVVGPHVDQGLYYIAEDDAGLIGVFRFQREDRFFWPEMQEADAAYLHKVAVPPARQGRDQAQRLLAAARDIARGQGLRFLRLDCIGGRPKLRAVYERFGFRHHSDKVLGRTEFHRFELEL